MSWSLEFQRFIHQTFWKWDRIPTDPGSPVSCYCRAFFDSQVREKVGPFVGDFLEFIKVWHLSGNLQSLSISKKNLADAWFPTHLQKICASQIGAHFPKDRGENKQYLKPPPSNCLFFCKSPIVFFLGDLHDMLVSLAGELNGERFFQKMKTQKKRPYLQWYTACLIITVDGRNPAPPGMSKTL